MKRDRHRRAGSGTAKSGKDELDRAKTIVVKLRRGGPQWWTYHQLSPDLKQEWETVEDVIEMLGRGRYLYSYGTIHAQRVRSKYWVGKTETHRAVGITAVPTRTQLHEILVCNVRGRFHFVVGSWELSDSEVMEIYTHIDACLPRTDLIERYAYVHCAMVELTDHACFEVICRNRDNNSITAAIQQVLGHAPSV